jgi:hypothetical protein
VKAAMIAAAALIALTGTAAAEPRTTISVQPRAMVAHGLSVEVERDLPAQHVSVVGAVSMRSTAGGDYDSMTAGLGGEVRYWLRRRAIWTKRPRGAAIGWYVAGRVDLERTSLRDGMDERVGAMSTVAFAALVGYRFAPWRGLEVRPFTGLAHHVESGGDLPSWHRSTLVYGLSLGWSF